MRKVVYLNHKDIWEMIKFIKTQNRDMILTMIY